MRPERREELLALLLDGSIGEADRLEILNEAASDPEFGRAVVSLLQLSANLPDVLAGDDRGDGFVRRVSHEFVRPSDSSVFIRTLLKNVAVTASSRRIRASGRRRTAIWLGSFVAVLVLSVTGWVVGTRRPPDPGVSAPVRTVDASARKETPSSKPAGEIAKTGTAEPRPAAGRPPEAPPPIPVAPVAPIAPSAPRAPETTMAPEKPPSPAPARPTRVVVARIESGSGEVFVRAPGCPELTRVEPGRELTGGDEVVVGAFGSSAVLAQGDSARLDLGPGARLSYAVSGNAAVLAEGRLGVELPAAARANELTLRTHHAELRADAGRFTVTAGRSGTRIDAHQGAAADVLDLATGKVGRLRSGQVAAFHGNAQVDPAKVDAAIRKGVAYLKGQVGAVKPFEHMGGAMHSGELVLWTFLHAGLAESDREFDGLLRDMMARPMLSTYCVSLQAMILEELDRVAHQGRIAACAQFLLDNQCKNGQWGYGTATAFAIPPADPPAVPSRRAVADFGKPGRPVKPKVVRRIAVRKMRDGPEVGDNSNAQYAALGLRACHDAGIDSQREAVQLALKWWKDTQHADDRSRPDPYAGKGWCYGNKEEGYGGNFCDPFASMTAGGVGSVAIYDFILGRDWKRDPSVTAGFEWLARHFSVSENFGQPWREVQWKWFHYYYLYSLERAGALAEREKIGPFQWYPEGARFLLEQQKSDGRWEVPDAPGTSVWNTSYAILFLRRATQPLDVASQDPRLKDR